jgi:hypothetical protein
MKSWIRTVVVAMLGALAAAPAARAQQDDSLATGARYRILLPKLPDRDDPQFPASRWVTGELVARRADSLVVRPHPTTGTLSVPLASVERLEQSRGVSRVASAVEGAVGGALGGVVLGLLLYQLDVRGSGFNTRAQAVGTMAAHTAGGAFIAGLLFPTERWKRVEKPAAH